MHYLTHLDVRDNRLRSILDIVPPPTGLRKADLRGNPITETRNLSLFTALEELRLDKCRLERFWPKLGYLPALRTLTVTRNR